MPGPSSPLSVKLPNGTMGHLRAGQRTPTWRQPWGSPLEGGSCFRSGGHWTFPGQPACQALRILSRSRQETRRPAPPRPAHPSVASRGHQVQSVQRSSAAQRAAQAAPESSSDWEMRSIDRKKVSLYPTKFSGKMTRLDCAGGRQAAGRAGRCPVSACGDGGQALVASAGGQAPAGPSTPAGSAVPFHLSSGESLGMPWWVVGAALADRLPK